MKKIIFLLCAVTLYWGCQQPEPQREFTGDEQFRTTDPSRLYFKNMRSVYYYLENKPHAKADIFWLKRYSKAKDRPILYAKIVNDWMRDEAYIFVENGFYPHFPSDSLKLLWEDTTQDTSGQIILGTRSRQNQYAFCGQVYDALTKGYAFTMVDARGDTIPIFEAGDDRTHFTTTVRDYYRLTEVF